MENQYPETLVQVIRYFADPQRCFDFLVNLRWGGNVVCPRCQHTETHFIATRKIWRCKGCKKQFSIKVGTIFEDSQLALDTWLIALWMLTNSKNGISSCELARSLGIPQKTAWFVLHRLRFAVQQKSIEKLKGEVEADETFVGGKAKNMHFAKKKEKIKGRGAAGKTIVFGVVQRGNGHKNEMGKQRRPKDKIYSKVRLQVVPDTSAETLQTEIKNSVEEKSTLYTDAHRGYEGLSENYQHGVVDHAVKYVDGKIYTNSVENVWTLLDRMIDGTYTHCDPNIFPDTLTN